MKTCGVLLFAIGLCVAAENAAVKREAVTRGQRIVGGSNTSIQNFPYMAGMLFNWYGTLNYYIQSCGASILTQRTVLTAAHCLEEDMEWNLPQWWQIRVGSTFANSGGSVHAVTTFLPHEDYDGIALDVAIVQVATPFLFVPGVVEPARFATNQYTLSDEEPVIAIGWGTTSTFGEPVETLQEVDLLTINQAVCNDRWNILQPNMLCTGWLDIGGRDQCQGDSGGPLIHNGNVVGICSFGGPCADPYLPGVNVRVPAIWQWVVRTLPQLQ